MHGTPTADAALAQNTHGYSYDSLACGGGDSWRTQRTVVVPRTASSSSPPPSESERLCATALYTRAQTTPRQDEKVELGLLVSAQTSPGGARRPLRAVGTEKGLLVAETPSSPNTRFAFAAVCGIDRVCARARRVEGQHYLATDTVMGTICMCARGAAAYLAGQSGSSVVWCRASASTPPIGQGQGRRMVVFCGHAHARCGCFNVNKN